MADPRPLTDADRDALVAYLDGELDATEQQRVEILLGRNPSARAEADALQHAWDLLDYLPQSDLSPDFTHRTLDRVSALRPSTSPATAAYRRTALGYAAWAAAVLLALAVGYRLGPSPRPAGPPAADLDADPVLAREPRLIENLPLYLSVENLDYLQALDTPELFGEDAVGR
jgi:anti-sigma factor RsiW